MLRHHNRTNSSMIYILCSSNYLVRVALTLNYHNIWLSISAKWHFWEYHRISQSEFPVLFYHCKKYSFQKWQLNHQGNRAVWKGCQRTDHRPSLFFIEHCGIQNYLLFLESTQYIFISGNFCKIYYEVNLIDVYVKCTIKYITNCARLAHKKNKLKQQTKTSIK